MYKGVVCAAGHSQGLRIDFSCEAGLTSARRAVDWPDNGVEFTSSGSKGLVYLVMYVRVFAGGYSEIILIH
jgi:hypothetical protein